MPKEWKLKVSDDDAKTPVFQDGKPVYLDPDGKEVALDPISMYSKIIELGKEAKTHRESSEGHVKTLKLFEGIEDLADWKTKADEAITTVENFNDKDWMKAEKVDKLKADMKSAYDEQVTQVKQSFVVKETEYQDTVSKKDAQIRQLMVSNQFASSPFFSGTDPKTNLPPEIAETYFGKHFKVEEKDGALQLVAYNHNGEPFYSRENPGEVAGFHESMSFIFDAYPGKEQLLRSGKGGSGAGGGQGGGGGGDTDDLDKLRKQYAQAQKDGNHKLMIGLKNQIFALEQSLRKSA